MHSRSLINKVARMQTQINYSTVFGFVEKKLCVLWNIFFLIITSTVLAKLKTPS